MSGFGFWVFMVVFIRKRALVGRFDVFRGTVVSFRGLLEGFDLRSIGFLDLAIICWGV